MGKSYKRSDENIQILKRENKKLKEQISKLRKVIKNIDIQHYKFVQDLLNSELFVDEKVEKTLYKNAEKKWNCFKCSEGVMQLVLLNRVGEPHYLRKCTLCDNRTKLKKYVEGVE